MATNLVACNCKSDKAGNPQGANFQDKQYGKGMRLYTDSPLGKKQHCTVCGKERIKG